VAVTGDRVCVVGNLCTDLILRGVQTLPAWGTEVTAKDRVVASAGQAGYLAMALAALGSAVSVVSAVGGDDDGESIRADLAAAGVDISAVAVVPGSATALSVAIVRPDGERSFVSHFGSPGAFTAADIERHWASVEQSRAACLVGLFNLPGLDAESVQAMLARLRRAGTTTVLDPGWDPAGWPPETLRAVHRWLPETDLLLVNRDEAAAMTGTAGVEAAAAALVAAGSGTVVVKCGPDGSYAARLGEQVHVGARRVTEVDAVGAGDTFNAGFLSAVFDGAGLNEALGHGNAAASVYISRPVNRFPSRADLEEALKQ
jgi:sugar/nucleoside kinase (ribokinase family)